MSPKSLTAVMRSVADSDWLVFIILANMDFNLDEVSNLGMLAFIHLGRFRFTGRVPADDLSGRKMEVGEFIRDALTESDKYIYDGVTAMGVESLEGTHIAPKLSTSDPKTVTLYGSGDYSSKIQWLILDGLIVDVDDYISVGSYCLGCEGFLHGEASRMKLHADYAITCLWALPAEIYYGGKFNATNIGIVCDCEYYNARWGIEVAESGWWIRKYYNGYNYASSLYVSNEWGTGFLSLICMYQPWSDEYVRTFDGNVRFIFSYTDTIGATFKRTLNVSIMMDTSESAEDHS